MHQTRLVQQAQSKKHVDDFKREYFILGDRPLNSLDHPSEFIVTFYSYY